MNFTQILIRWYSINKRNLPWRETLDPYTIWLSEIILQQTQIAQGLPYFETFISRYPTVFSLANATEEEVLKLWQGLGYYSRARNLFKTASFIANELSGVFPNNYNSLLKLKGVGDYTASAIASICYDEKAAVVDGNVYRVLSRYFEIYHPINSSKGIKYFKELAQGLLPEQDVGNYNQAIMDFGSSQCKPQNPDCISCPLKNGCKALQKNKVNIFPVKTNKVTIKKKYFNFIVLLSENGKTILEKRIYNGIWKNLYQFPLVETKQRLIPEKFQSNSHINQLIQGNQLSVSLFNPEEIIHKLSHQHLYCSFWIVHVDEIQHNAILCSQIHEYPVPILISRFIENFAF